MVTHDERVLDLCDRIVTIKDGALVEEQAQKRSHTVQAKQLEMARS